MKAARPLFAALIVALPFSTFNPVGSLAGSSPMSRPAFEKLLMERANPDSLGTDTAGAWDGLYQHLSIARSLDRTLYERALLQLNDPSCDAHKRKEARLSCAANHAASVASSIKAFAAAVDFRQDAVVYAERGDNKDRGALVDALIDLAFDEQLYGNLFATERASARVGELLAADPSLITLKRRFQSSLIRARIADARLEDTAAGQAFSDAVTAAIQSRTRARSSSNPDFIRTAPLDELVRQYIQGRFCATCGASAAVAVRQWIASQLTGVADEDVGTKLPQSAYLLMALSLTRDGFSKVDLSSYVQRYLQLVRKNGGIHPSAQRALPPRIDDLSKAKLFALVGETTATSDTTTAEFAQLLSAMKPEISRSQFDHLIAIHKNVIENNFEQFGAVSAVSKHLSVLARNFQTFGLRQQARATLQLLMTRDEAVDKPSRRREWEKLTSVYAPALARLASLEFDAGDRASALLRLDEASALITNKLRAEWAAGGAGAILALRDLGPTFRLIAQKRAEILVPTGLSRNGTGHDTLFRELQRAMFGETALAVEVANQRRILADEALRDLSRRYHAVVGEAERAIEIAGYGHSSGDVDGALAAVRRSAEARRNALEREFRERVPPSHSAAADIDPVPLAEVTPRLRPGEALVLLHVGSHGLHGFLLDTTGQSYAWRTLIRREAIEELVRNLRGAGDVTRGVQPFPAADAAKLHALIFGPAQARLSAYNKLLLVGDGPLQAMPYGLLLTRATEIPADPGAYRAAALPWLIRTHALALLPSVRTLVTQRAGTLRSGAAKPFLGIGDPSLAPPELRVADGSGALRGIDVSAAFQTSGGLADVSVLRRLVSLPETADELRAIATLLKAPPEALLLGAGATERAVRAAPLVDYRVIAFATHGALAGEVTGTSEPGLVLTPPATASREDDGFLGLSEISGLRFDADLVMLSACNTATPDGRPRAEGLSGLARGFFNAGARSLLATHWAIPSEASVKLTTGLIAYQAERPEADWAEALRIATLAVIDREGPAAWAHPAYWAGYAVLGVRPAQP